MGKGKGYKSQEGSIDWKRLLVRNNENGDKKKRKWTEEGGK